MNKSKLMRREAVEGACYLAPSALMMMCFTLIPIVASFLLSFTDYSVLSDPQFCGLDNYAFFFKDRTAQRALINSCIYTAVTVPFTAIISLTIAAACAQYFRGPFGNFIRGALFLPVVASGAIISTVWVMLLSNRGLINVIALDLFDKAINFLGSKKISIFVICFINIWKDIGYFAVIYYAGIMDIPVNLYEAAEVDGASSFQRFLHITLPNLKSVTYLVITLCTIWSFQAFDIVKILTDGGPGVSTISLVMVIFRSAFKEYRMGYACAVSMILLVFVVTVSLIQKAILRKGED